MLLINRKVGAILSITVITVRMEEKLKEQFENIVNDVGLNMTTAITAFAKAVVREDGIPFDLYRKKDSYYSPENIKSLKESIEQHQCGEEININSVEELEKTALKVAKQVKHEH
jgi:DNA-damage-inducible protein J